MGYFNMIVTNFNTYKAILYLAYALSMHATFD